MAGKMSSVVSLVENGERRHPPAVQQPTAAPAGRRAPKKHAHGREHQGRQWR